MSSFVDNSENTVVSPSRTPAPLNILQTWKTTELIIEHYDLVMKMRSHNPNAKNLFFVDENIEQFVLMFFPTYFDAFKRFRYTIQRIDFFRYLAVYHYGGLYLDLDMDIVKGFDDLDRSKAIFPIETRDPESGSILIGNYAFYAPPNHPFLLHIINSIVNPIITETEIQAAQQGHGDPKEHVYVYFTTGPELVTKAYHTYAGNDVILLEPSGGYKANRFGDYGLHRCFGTWK
jgi:mannosyltransferase OCH1-like enzyme